MTGTFRRRISCSAATRVRTRRRRKPSTFRTFPCPVWMAGGLGNEGTFAGDSRWWRISRYELDAHDHTDIPDGRQDGFNRFNLDYRQEGAVEGARLGEKLGVPNANQAPQANGIPITGMSGYQGIGSAIASYSSRGEHVSPTVTFTNLRGRHTFNSTARFTAARSPAESTGQPWQRPVSTSIRRSRPIRKPPLTPSDTIVSFWGRWR